MTGPDQDGTYAGRPQTHNMLSGAAAGPVAQVGVVHGDVVQHYHELSHDVAPSGLPPRAAQFVDRDLVMAEMDRCRALCSDGRVPVLVLIGPGGVGKTAAAVEWLHRRRPEAIYGALHADLRGPNIGAAVLHPSEVLARFLRELGVHPRLIPDGLEERRSRFRSVTAKRNVLLLLDNPSAATQVRDLLPTSPGNMVVVTSRFRAQGLVELAGAQPVDLDPLDSDASLDLLTRVVTDGRIAAAGGTAHTLTRLCDGLPLALWITASTLTNHPSWSVEDVVDRLSIDRHRLLDLSVEQDLSVRTVFDDSYDELGADTQKTYRTLGLHPGSSFTADAVAHALEIPVARAAEQLEALYNACLLVEVSAGRFGFHDLVRVDARRRAEDEDQPEDRDTAVERLLDWYLRRTADADAAIMPGRWRLNAYYDRIPTASSPQAEEHAWKWLETERANILVCVRIASATGRHELVWMFCEALWSLYFRRQYYDDWIQTHELGVPAAVQLHDGRAEGRMRCQLGIAYVERKRFDDARSQFTQALEADRAAGHQRGEATAWEQLGALDESAGRFDDALAAFTTALSLTEDNRANAINWHRLGRVHLATGHLAEADQAFRRSLDLLAALEPPDPYNVARVRTSLGEKEIRLAHGAEARELLAAALPVMMSERAALQEAKIRHLLAEAYLLLDDRVAARVEARQAFSVYAELARSEAVAVQTLLDELDMTGRP
jgi:tetratricopeptide (TPR) repeat protein